MLNINKSRLERFDKNLKGLFLTKEKKENLWSMYNHIIKENEEFEETIALARKASDAADERIALLEEQISSLKKKTTKKKVTKKKQAKKKATKKRK